MRILHLIHRYHPARGGAETLMENISQHLVRAGHQVTVVTSDSLDYELFWDPERRRVAELNSIHKGVTIKRFPVRHLPLSRLTFPAIRRILWGLSSLKLAPVSLLKRLSRYAPWLPDFHEWAATTSQSYDLVAAMTITFDPFFEVGYRLAKRQGVPFVTYPLTHLGAGSSPGLDKISRYYTMRHQTELVATSDAIVALTPAEATFYQVKGVPAERIKVISPGLSPEKLAGGDGDRFRATHQLEDPIILSIGAMSFDKGTFHLVEAIRQLQDSGRRVNLVLIGEKLSNFQAFLKEQPPRVRENIKVLGSVDDAEKRDALDAADIMVLPSRTESFGTVYLEAWFYSTPVIGAHTYAVQDVISHEQDGLLVPFGDTSAIAESIAYLLDNPAVASDMGQMGRSKVLNDHTWQEQGQKLLQLYNSLTTRN